MKALTKILFCGLICFTFSAQAQQTGYMKPPSAITDIVDAPAPPRVSMSPDKSLILYTHRAPLPSIEELAEPELRIGGLRINPQIFSRARTRPYISMKFQKPGEKAEREVKGIPSGVKIQHLSWSSDSKHIAFSNTTDMGLELWIADTETFSAKRLGDFYLNAAMTSPIEWADNENILALKAPYKADDVPKKSAVPAGPNVQQNLGVKAPVRTYQDMLKNQGDVELFNFYTTSQLVQVSLNGMAKNLGVPAVYRSVSISPDGSMIMAKKLKEPYSYVVPYSRFPTDVEILNRNGETSKVLASIPLQEKRPKGFDATQSGPRSHGWRSDQPHTVYYVEALDGGDPKKEFAKRDAIYLVEAPFDAPAQKMFETTKRFSSIDWGNESVALVNERWWTSRNQIVTKVDPQGKLAAKELINRSTEDRYNDPGRPMRTYNESGKSVLYLTDTEDIYMMGAGASPKGERPFIDQMNLNTGRAERIWQSAAPYYEIPVALVDGKKSEWLTRRESPKENPNYFMRNLKKDKITQITSFPHPYPELKDIQKEMIQYERADGLMLSAELYLPAGYKKEDGPLPTFIWAYPREFKSKKDAAQVNGSPYKFKSLSFYGPIPWVTQGYAVFNNAAMPIVGEGDQEPNDSFREQLVANAKAAIDEGVRRGVTDPNKVGVGGHSYGAFMTANLLAHSDLFQAGIARSGAYNRTLTPFGFQREERTYWEAPEIYFNMSPFMHAEKVNEPILLLHGEADNNSGTFPIQSERFYHALKGHGATARYVTLPHESHGYRARESVLHMLFEMDTWMDTHVKKSKKTLKP